MTLELDATTAYQLIMRGPVPKDGLIVHGSLSFGSLGHMLPDNLQVDMLTLGGIRWLHTLPAGLRCQFLVLHDLPLVSLPEDLQVTEQLFIERCLHLERLPETLLVKSLILYSCPQLAALPACPETIHLAISGCSGLRAWPATGPEHLLSLGMARCVGLRSLPPWLKRVATLDIRDCVALRKLPEDLLIEDFVEIGGCALQSLPKSFRDGKQRNNIRWHGVIIDEQIACHPETLRAQDVFNCPNVEKRRVMLERMGYERFLADANAEILDEDQDAGGPRRLLRVPLEADEPLVCLAVRDPSTGRQYVLRVPPTMTRCQQAAAWMAGFDTPDDYRLIAET